MPEGLTVEQLHVSHRAPAAAGAARPILSGIDLAVAPGEFVALVGASGSGKTMTAMSVLGLLPPQVHLDSGSIRLGGTDLARAGEAELNRVRGGRMGMLYQQPKRMFNPRRTVLDHLREPLRLHAGLRGAPARERALELLDRERRDRGLGVLYITHNLATVSAYADRVVVMDAGRVLEAGPAGTVLNSPRSACTKALLEAASLTPAGTPPTAAGPGAALALEGVTKTYARGRRGGRPALERVTLELREREILGVLGQSGSGKSTLARLIVGLETPDDGRITRAPEPADGTGPAGTTVQLVFQEPHDSFDPRMRLRTSLEAPLQQHRDLAAEERDARLHDVVREVELDPGLLDRYPGQCSGGQLQRLTIARALLLEPAVLICDEATSALDAATQRTVLDLLLRLHRNRSLSLIMISHDLSVIRYMSHRVAVLHRGSLVELAPTHDFFADPRHEHSRQLVAAALPRVCAILDSHPLPRERRDALA